MNLTMKDIAIAFAEDDINWHSNIEFYLSYHLKFEFLFGAWNGYDLLEKLKKKSRKF